MTTKTELPNKKVKNKIGDILECTNSASPGYKKGLAYEVVMDEAGVLGLKGGDGYFDPLSQLVSTFKKSEVKRISVVN